MENKKIVLIVELLLCLVLAYIIVFNPIDKVDFNSNTVSPLDKAKEFNSQNALEFAGNVCKLGSRYAGNEAELKAADMMENELKKNGLDVHKEKVDLGNGKYTNNVIGEIKGSKYPDRYIIIGSHLDSPGSNVGAIDDAAGMGIQTEMARVLTNHFKPEKTVLIIGFGGEELWFKGSEDFVEKHPDIVKNCEGMIESNCVGAGENVYLTRSTDQPKTTEGDPKLIGLLEQCASDLGHPVTTGDTTFPSDTYPFYYNNITKVPVCQIMSVPLKVRPWSSDDTADKLDPKDIEKVGQTVTMTVMNLTINN
jgi:aminopeptidase YwaD